jgi:hypothetical protein
MATSEFGKAFRAARNAGSTEFEFNGKKYNTKLKDEGEKKAAPKEVSSAKNISQEEGEKIAAKSRAITAGPPRSLSDPRSLSGTSISDIFSTPSAKNVGGDAAKAAQDKRDSSPSFTKGTIFENFGDFGAKNVGGDAAKAAQDKRDSSQKDFAKDTVVEDNKKGGVIKKMASGGMASASRRGDGIAQRGKTRGKMC